VEQDRLFDSLRDMQFVPSKAEDDIWMRDKGDHYEYISVYVDDLAIASRHAMGIIEELEKGQGFKLKGTGPITYHLGCDYKRDKDGTLAMGPVRYIERMAEGYERTYGTRPKLTYRSPLEPNDHPEIDDTPLLEVDSIKQDQSMIGALQWCVTLGRIDIHSAVTTMSSFNAAPRQAHLERVKRMYGYLYKMRYGYNRVRTKQPGDYSDVPRLNYEWSHCFRILQRHRRETKGCTYSKKKRRHTYSVL